MDKLSRNALGRIDGLVEQAARKAGFTGRGDITYQELLQRKFEEQYGNILRTKDFIEEIKTYLRDGLLDLIEEGYSEEEAIKITMDKFDETDLKDTFADFAKAFDSFGFQEHGHKARERRSEEAISLFYGFSVLMGMGLGILVGYLGSHTWLGTITGFFVGLFVGIGLGLLTNAIIVLKKK